MRHSPRIGVLVLFGAAIALLALAPLAGASKKPKKLHLTATVSKGSVTGPIVFAMTKGGKAVGSANYPSCERSGERLFCEGTVTVHGLGTNLESVLGFECTSSSLSHCNPGLAGLGFKHGASKGTMELKVQLKKLKPGLAFPVLVVEEKG